MADNYAPRQEVLLYAQRVLINSDNLPFMKMLGQFSGGRVKNSKQALDEIIQGTDFGKSLYSFLEQAYDVV